MGQRGFEKKEDRRSQMADAGRIDRTGRQRQQPSTRPCAGLACWTDARGGGSHGSPEGQTTLSNDKARELG